MSTHVEYYPTSLPKKAVTMVVHGLNVRPTAMLSLIGWLNKIGSDAFLVKLSGHFEKSINITGVSSVMWEEEFIEAYARAKEASVKISVPLYFMAYSFGALLGEVMITFSKGSISFDKQILIAPATAIRLRSHLLKVLFFFNKNKNLPSYTPKEYRANNSLPLKVHKILFEQEKKLLKSHFRNLNIPTIIFIDPLDELISYKRLIKMTLQFQLTNYEVIRLNDDLSGRREKYHHLILDECTMGKKNWEMVTNKIRNFLHDENKL
jgi:esterase/lipase